MRYLEDLRVGEVTVIGSFVVDRDELVAFAAHYDPQPFHLQAEAEPFGGLIASGWHTGSMFSRLCVDGFLSDFVNLGGQGFDEVRFLVPVRPGDELFATVEVVDVRESQRKRDRGTLTIAGALRNRAGTTVFTIRMRVRIARRPGQDAQPR